MKTRFCGPREARWDCGDSGTRSTGQGKKYNMVPPGGRKESTKSPPGGGRARGREKIHREKLKTKAPHHGLPPCPFCLENPLHLPLSWNAVLEVKTLIPGLKSSLISWLF